MWGEIAPHGVQRDARQLRALRGDSLFAAVVATLLTYVVRTLHGLALRALLNDDGRGTFASLAEAFPLLGDASFWNGHGTAGSMVKTERSPASHSAVRPSGYQASPARRSTYRR
jgi:hypothetical protein